jgi:two-component system cell cycle response regulator DivK
MTAHALIIDANRQNGLVLETLLAKQGLTATQVAKPSQLPALLPDLPDVRIIFVELNMTGSSGDELLPQLRANSRVAEVPIVAYTVHLNEMAKAYQQGFDGFVGKPLDADRFPDQLTRILRGEAVWERN